MIRKILLVLYKRYASFRSLLYEISDQRIGSQFWNLSRIPFDKFLLQSMSCLTSRYQMPSIVWLVKASLTINTIVKNAAMIDHVSLDIFLWNRVHSITWIMRSLRRFLYTCWSWLTHRSSFAAASLMELTTSSCACRTLIREAFNCIEYSLQAYNKQCKQTELYTLGTMISVVVLPLMALIPIHTPYKDQSKLLSWWS